MVSFLVFAALSPHDLGSFSPSRGIPTKTTVSSLSVVIGSWTRMNARVVRADTGLSPGKVPVTFKLQGNPIGTSLSDAYGQASIDVNMTELFRPEKNAQVYAEFAGDSTFKGSSGTSSGNIFIGDSKLKVTAPSAKTGSTVKFSVQLLSANGFKDGSTAPLGNRKLQLSVDGRDIASVNTDSKGTVTVSYIIPAKGGHRLDVLFATGDRYYNGAKDTAYFTGL